MATLQTVGVPSLYLGADGTYGQSARIFFAEKPKTVVFSGEDLAMDTFTKVAGIKICLQEILDLTGAFAFVAGAGSDSSGSDSSRRSSDKLEAQ